MINRSEERGQQLVEALHRDTSAAVQFVPWSSTYVVAESIDILVNATSIGLYPAVEALPDIALDQAHLDLFICDVIPNPLDTRFDAAGSLTRPAHAQRIIDVGSSGHHRL